MNGPAFRGAEAVHFGLSRAIFGAFCMKRHIFTKDLCFSCAASQANRVGFVRVSLCLLHVCCRFLGVFEMFGFYVETNSCRQFP